MMDEQRVIAPVGNVLRTLIVIPAYNEEGKIGKVIGKIPSQLAETVLVVDDCSRDGTSEEARNAGALVIRHEKNMGVGAGIRSGIDFALENRYSVVAILSGDDQHDPSDLYGVLRMIQQEGYDFVQGSRRLGGLDAPNIRWFRRLFTWVYAVTFRLLTGFPCTDATNGGRAFRTSIFNNKKINLWQDWLNTYELEPYLFFQVVRQGYRVTEAPMKVIYHDQGTTKMKPFRDWWRILRPMIFLTLRIRN
jgi:dolichol-phosphate mannosyltransferase